MCALASRCNKKGLKIWSRHDPGTGTYHSTSKNGPHWQQFYGRFTVRCHDPKIFDESVIGDIPKFVEHARLPSGRTDTVTFLLFAE